MEKAENLKAFSGNRSSDLVAPENDTDFLVFHSFDMVDCPSFDIGNAFVSSKGFADDNVDSKFSKMKLSSFPVSGAEKNNFIN